MLILAEVIYDRIKHRNLYRLNDAFANISCGIIEQISGLFAKVFTVAAYHVVYTNFAFFELENAWYWWLLCFIGVDFCYYWAHRLSHEVNILWLGHVVHHQSEDYNLSVALRQSTFQKVLTFWVYLPLALLGFKTEWFVLVGAYNLLYQFWIHTEVVGRLGWFEYIFNTPSHHRVHHGKNPQYIDRNHGGTLIIFDRMFGTFEPERERCIYGVTKPLSTFNPVSANLRPFADLWKEMRATPGLSNKLKLAFMPPGWSPDSTTAQTLFKSTPTAVEDTKYDVPLPAAAGYYLFIQFALLLGASAVFLFQAGNLALGWQIACGLVIVYSAMSLGVMFDAPVRTHRVEGVRLLFSVAFLGVCVAWMNLPAWVLMTGFVWALTSVAAIWRMRSKKVFELYSETQPATTSAVA